MDFNEANDFVHHLVRVFFKHNPKVEDARKDFEEDGVTFAWNIDDGGFCFVLMYYEDDNRWESYVWETVSWGTRYQPPEHELILLETGTLDKVFGAFLAYMVAEELENYKMNKDMPPEEEDEEVCSSKG